MVSSAPPLCPRRPAGLLLVGLLVLFAASCGGLPPLELSPTAAQGRRIANTSGCASCHGKNGQGVTAPSWQKLYNEPVPLSDGSVVIADDAYLASSITDPQHQIVKDYTLKMPSNSLDDAEIELVIAYIKELR